MSERLKIPQIPRRDFLYSFATLLVASTLVECQVNFASPLRVTVEKDGSARIEYREPTSWYLTVHLPFGIGNPETGDFRIEIPEETWGGCTQIKISIPHKIGDLGFLIEIGPDRNSLRMVLSTRKDNMPRGMGEWEVGLPQGGDEAAQIFEGGWQDWRIKRVIRNGRPLEPQIDPPQRWPDGIRRSEVLHFERCGQAGLTV